MDRRIKSVDNQESSELVSRLIAGDVDTFKEIYREYFNKIFYFVCRFSLSKEDAEEIAQDVFIKLWKKKSSICVHKDLSGFLFTIAKNLVIDKIRQYVATEKRMQQLRAKSFETSSAESTEQLVNFYELSGIISNLINELPGRRRTIFKLSREKGLTYHEISDILKISQGTVEKQMSRALRSIIADLKNKYGILIDLVVVFPLLPVF